MKTTTRTPLLPGLRAPLLATLLAALPATGALAQGQKPQRAAPAQAQPAPSSPAAIPATTPTPVVLSDDVFRLESIGLSIKLPPGAIAQKSAVGDQVTGQIMPGPGQPQWLLNIQTPRSADERITARKVAEEVLDQVRAQFGVTDDKGNVVRTEVEIVDRVRELRFGADGPRTVGAPARFYAKTPAGTDRGQKLVRGYTVMGLGDGRFVVFDLTVPQADFDRVRPLYETMVLTARFEDQGALEQARGLAVTAGMTVLTSLSPADFEAVINANRERWFRLYRPSATGADNDAAELGYVRVRAWVGAKADVDRGEPSAAAPRGGADAGYVVKIEARQIQGQAQGEQFVDSIGTYFMSATRQEELWTLQVAVREAAGKRVSQTYTETGARSGSSMSVTVSGSTQPRTITPFVPDTGYMNQVEAFLLPQLLVRKNLAAAGPTELGFYTYQSEFSNIRFRRDAIAADPKRAGAIRVTTKPNEDRDAFVSILNEQGEPVRTSMADGSVREPIELPRLLSLWKSKGLPVD